MRALRGGALACRSCRARAWRRAAPGARRCAAPWRPRGPACAARARPRGPRLSAARSSSACSRAALAAPLGGPALLARARARRSAAAARRSRPVSLARSGPVPASTASAARARRRRRWWPRPRPAGGCAAAAAATAGRSGALRDLLDDDRAAAGAAGQRGADRELGAEALARGRPSCRRPRAPRRRAAPPVAAAAAPPPPPPSAPKIVSLSPALGSTGSTSASAERCSATASL